MPTVPVLSNTVSPTSSAPGGFAAPTEQNAAPQEGAQLGDALKGAGSAATGIAIDMQQQANQVRVDDALNKTRQSMLTLQYDPQVGYQNLKGDAALTRPDGVALPQEYGDKLGSTVSDIAGTLGNDAQRRAYMLQAGDLQTQFQAGVQQHMLSEYKDYALSTQDGTIKLGVNQAKLNWDKPDIVNQNLDSVRAAVYRQGSLQGQSANEITAQMQQVVSATHTGVIQAAIENQNPSYAMDYLANNKGSMTADDILKVTGLTTHYLEGSEALGAVHAAVAKLAPATSPTDMGRLTNIVQGMESGGNAGAVGPNVPGQGTAKGAMQVMDATNGNPGFGVTPAQDDSPEERARVGKDYLAAMVTKYGNAAQAMAAYNAGPGNVDAALAKAKSDGAPQNWLNYLPAETQKYVTNGVQQLQSGAGAPQFPTESQFIQTALSSLGQNPRASLVAITQQQASAQYQILNKSRLEQGDQAVQAAQQALIQNGGNFAAISPQLKAAVQQYAPDKYDNLLQYAGSISAPIKSDNLAAYNQFISNPDEMVAMPDSVFESKIKANFTPATAETLSRLRDDWATGRTDLTSDTIHQRVFNDTINNRLLSIGINPTPKESDVDARAQIGTIKKYVHDSVQSVQTDTGKQMTPNELSQHITGLFAKDATFQNTVFGISTGTSSQKLMSMTPSDIPPDSMAALKQSFVKAGNPNPTNDQLMRAYWKVKNGQ